MPPIRLTTAKGIEVELRYTERYDDGHRKDYDFDSLPLVEAYVEERPAGYLSVVYVAREVWDKYYSTLLEWVAYENPGGIFADLAPLLNNRPRDQWDLAHYKAVLRVLTSGYGSDKKIHEIEQMSLDEARKALAKKEQSLEWSYGERYARDREEVAKPVIYQSRIYQAGDALRDHHACVRLHTGAERMCAELDYQRLGIATAMYEAMAIWMTERGMCLYASVIRTPEAKALWGHLNAKYGIEVEMRNSARGPEERVFLDGSKINLPGPSLASLQQATTLNFADAYTSGIEYSPHDGSVGNIAN